MAALSSLNAFLDGKSPVIYAPTFLSTPFNMVAKDPRNAFRSVYCISALAVCFVCPAASAIIALAKTTKELSDWCSILTLIKDLQGKKPTSTKIKAVQDNTSVLSIPDLTVDISDIIECLSVKKIVDLSKTFLESMALISGLMTLWTGLSMHAHSAKDSSGFLSKSFQERILAISLMGLGAFSSLEAFAQLRAMSDTAERIIRYTSLVALPLVPHFAMLMLAFTSMLAFSTAVVDYYEVTKPKGDR